MNQSTMFTASIMDRATEWVSENYPDLEGEDLDSKIIEAAQDLAKLDEANDSHLVTDAGN